MTDTLYDRLIRLLDSQVEELIYRAGVPTQYLSTGARAGRVLDLVRWAEQSPERLARIEESLARMEAALGAIVGERTRSSGPSTRRQAKIEPAAVPPRPRKEPPVLPTEIPKDRSGLQRIAGCDDPERALDIVFVHGLGGDAWTTWMTDPADIRTFWPAWVAQDFPQAGIWTLGYAASATKWKEESMPLADRGNQVLDLIESDGLGERPLVFITHSMGGIVVKQFLRHAESYGVPRWEGVSRQTRGIAFIATPHSGARIAAFAELASAVFRTNEHVKELGEHDSRLRDLHGWFLKFQRDRGVVCRTYCERREVRPEIPLLGIKLPKGLLVVDETSAEPNIPGERAVPLDEDHISVCKPPNREAQLYKSISRFLSECQRSVPRPL